MTSADHRGGRIAITGGSGFIGSHVVDRMIASGHDTVVLDIRPPHRPDVAFREVDVLDLARVVTATRDCDVIFHLAGVSEASRRNSVGRTVLASTAWVYAGAQGDAPIDEEAPFHLPSAGHIYTSSKITEELIAHNYNELYGTPFTILRYGDVYGPRMPENFVIPQFVRQALAGEPITVHGDGSQFRNYVYVEDLADAHVLALASEAENQVFNLKGPEPITIRRVAEAIHAMFDVPFAVEYGDLSPGDYAGRVISGDKAKRVLGWEAGTSFTDGLRRYADWYAQATSVDASAGRGDQTR